MRRNHSEIKMSFETEFDLSIVTLKDIHCVITEEIGQMRLGKVTSAEIYKRNHQLCMYSAFLDKAIRIKMIDEMNKTYFGTKITLKNKLPQEEVVETAGGKYFGQDEPFPVSL